MLARHDGWPIAVRQGNIWATTFHPELTEDPRVHAALCRCGALVAPASPRTRHEQDRARSLAAASCRARTRARAGRSSQMEPEAGDRALPSGSCRVLDGIATASREAPPQPTALQQRTRDAAASGVHRLRDAAGDYLAKLKAGRDRDMTQARYRILRDSYRETRQRRPRRRRHAQDGRAAAQGGRAPLDELGAVLSRRLSAAGWRPPSHSANGRSPRADPPWAAHPRSSACSRARQTRLRSGRRPGGILREYEFTFVVQPEISDEGVQAISQRFEGILAEPRLREALLRGLGPPPPRLRDPATSRRGTTRCSTSSRTGR